MISKCTEMRNLKSKKLYHSITNFWAHSRCLNSTDTKLSETYAPPRHARVVICGGGVMGAAVAYHLAKLGWGPDTLVIEQSRYLF